MKIAKLKVSCPIDHGYVDGRGYLVIVSIGRHIVKFRRFASRIEQRAAAKAVRS